jgi:nuclear polyadenylated RNA-binding protein NAB2
MFYRGLGPDAPLVEGYVSPHRSVRFGSELKAELPTAKQDKELEQKDENDVEAVVLGKEKIGEKAVGVSA